MPSVMGSDAFGRAWDTHPDIIVTEISLPRFDGWSLVADLKRDPRTRDIPIVVLTSHAESSVRERAQREGVRRRLGQAMSAGTSGHRASRAAWPESRPMKTLRAADATDLESPSPTVGGAGGWGPHRGARRFQFLVELSDRRAEFLQGRPLIAHADL